MRLLFLLLEKSQNPFQKAIVAGIVGGIFALIMYGIRWLAHRSIPEERRKKLLNDDYDEDAPITLNLSQKDIDKKG